MKMVKRLSISLLLVVTAVVAIAGPAMAADEPDSVTLSDIKIYEDLIASGDMLAVVPYDIPFTVTPDDDIGDMFLFRMLSADGTTEIGAATPYPYYNLGYGEGVVSFYIESGGTWDEEYIFRVQENPAFYDSPNYWDFVVGPENYASSSDMALELKADIIDIATTLSTVYGVALLSTNDGIVNLSTYGEIYFQNAIPGLAVMTPTLFSVQVRTPTYTRRSWDYTLANALKTKWDDTFIGDFMTGYAGLFSTETETAMNFLSIILFALVMFISIKKFNGNLYSGFIDGYAFLMLLMLNGFFSMILTGFIAFISITAGGVILFLNRD